MYRNKSPVKHYITVYKFLLASTYRSNHLKEGRHPKSFPELAVNVISLTEVIYYISITHKDLECKCTTVYNHILRTVLYQCISVVTYYKIGVNTVVGSCFKQYKKVRNSRQF